MSAALYNVENMHYVFKGVASSLKLTKHPPRLWICSWNWLFVNLFPFLSFLVQEKNCSCLSPVLYPSLQWDSQQLIFFCFVGCALKEVMYLLRYILQACPWHSFLSDVRPWNIKWRGTCFSGCWDRILCWKGENNHFHLFA